jgi:nicotinamide riboside transporter PnuC
MDVLYFKMEKPGKTPWERRYQHATNNVLFGKAKKKNKWVYLLVIGLILILGFLFQ